MNEIAKLILAASALLLSGELAAQTFKCTDAAGKITYSGIKCSELGLKDAGEVPDRLNVNPAYQPPARAIASPPSPASAANARTPKRRPPAQNLPHRSGAASPYIRPRGTSPAATTSPMNDGAQRASALSRRIEKVGLPH